MTVNEAANQAVAIFKATGVPAKQFAETVYNNVLSYDTDGRLDRLKYEDGMAGLTLIEQIEKIEKEKEDEK